MKLARALRALRAMLQPEPPCQCGHGPRAHEHYRAGADCGLCGPLECPRYRRARRGYLAGILLIVGSAGHLAPFVHPRYAELTELARRDAEEAGDT